MIQAVLLGLIAMLGNAEYYSGQAYYQDLLLWEH